MGEHNSGPEEGIKGVVEGVKGKVKEVAAAVAELQKQGAKKLILDVRYSALGKGWRALAIHRAALFGTLHEAVTAAGIEILQSAEVVRAESEATDAAP